MKTLKRSSLSAAVLAGLGALTAGGAAHAVNVNPNGLGQILLYPYYTARGGNDTLITVINTTASTKVVKVRFLEGKNSAEVLDFNLFLSPFDVFTGAISATTDGAKFLTRDNSCTVPNIVTAFPNGVDFRNFQYSGPNADGEDPTLDRTREGYFEMIEMGNVIDPVIAGYAKHGSTGVPANCPALVALDSTTAMAAAVGAPSGGLGGSTHVVNVNNGTDFSPEPTAIDNWRTAASYTGAGSTLPSLNSGNVLQSNVFLSNTATVVTETWSNALFALNATIIHSNVINEFVLDTALAAGTDWVVTAPTKRFHTVGGTKGAANTAIPPFNEGFDTGGSCDDVSLSIFNREELTTSTPVDFSPRPPSGRNSLCWEATVITFSNSAVLGSKNQLNIPAPSGFQNGWLQLAFGPNALSLPPDSTRTAGLRGLPVIGFAAIDFVNGTLTVGGKNVLSNYGGNFGHKYSGR